MKKHSVDVCIVGGGPAGMLLALLLSHRGVKTLVLEKNHDFSREYRGEVLMPRFTQMLRQLGLEDWLNGLPQLKLKRGDIYFKSKLVGHLDFSRAAPDTPYALWMPQTVLLNALHEKAMYLPDYELWFDASAKHLIGGEKVQGVVVKHGNEEVEVSARVTVGADGRFSTIQKDGKFEIEYEDYKFDILWFTIPKPKDYENTFRVLFSPKRSYLLLPKFPDSIQAGILVEPHELAKMKEQGIESIRKEIASAHPVFETFAKEMKDFTVFHPLQAHLHFVKDWAKDGCVLIGDAAHCCSPAGAIGVSVAVGTAIVAADVIRKGLKEGEGILTKKVLDQIQDIREKDVRMIHRIQMFVVGGGLNRILPVRLVLPFMISLLAKTPFFLAAQKRLMAMAEPLPVDRDLGF